MVTTVFDEDLICLCKKHRVQLFLFEVDETFEYLVNEEDYELIRGFDYINPDNALQVITEWDKLTEEEKKMHYTYNELRGNWENITNADPYYEMDESEYERLRHTIYDTYCYYKKRIDDNDSVPCRNLELYKYAGQMQYCYSEWSTGSKTVFAGVLEALCFSIEKGFVNEENVESEVLEGTIEDYGKFRLDLTTYDSFDIDIQEIISKKQESDDED